MGEEVNWKKMLLLFQQKIWIIILMGVAGAVIGSSLYLLITVILAGETRYELEGGFYIEFAEGVLDAHDYYNAYTWNSVVHQDKILDTAMAALADAGVTELDREYVSDSVQADILSDVRYLTLRVTCSSPEDATEIFDAYEVALEQFGMDMKEFDSISVTHQPEPRAIVLPRMTWRATVIGTTIGFILATFYLMLSYLADDSIYLQEELQDRYGLLSFGVLGNSGKKESPADRKWQTYCQTECVANLEYKLEDKKQVAFIPVIHPVTNDKKGIMISLFDNIKAPKVENILMPQTQEEFKKVRAYDGVVLGIPYGCRNGRLIRKYMDELQKQDCTVLGALLIEADITFQRRYYQGVLKKR